MRSISDRGWKGAGQCVGRGGLGKFPVAWKRLPGMLKSCSVGHRVPLWYISLQSQSQPPKSVFYYVQAQRPCGGRGAIGLPNPVEPCKELAVREVSHTTLAFPLLGIKTEAL